MSFSVNDYNLIVKSLERDLYTVFMKDPQNYCDEPHIQACSEVTEIIITWALRGSRLPRALEFEASESLLAKVIYFMLRKQRPSWYSTLDRLSAQAAGWLIQNQVRLALSLNPKVVSGGIL